MNESRRELKEVLEADLSQEERVWLIMAKANKSKPYRLLIYFSFFF